VLPCCSAAVLRCRSADEALRCRGAAVLRLGTDVGGRKLGHGNQQEEIMRFITAGALAGAMVLGAVTVGAQASMKFSGMKLVDMRAHTPETTVNVLVDPSGLSIVDPVHSSPIKSFKYDGLQVTHTFNSAPPAAAGDPSTAATGSAMMPMYFGKDPRNWLTLKSGDATAVLRVSQHVFDKFKAALGEHNVKITEGK
jgi:hypothetical protein